MRAAAEELPLWRGLVTLLLTETEQPRKQWNVNLGFPAKLSDDYKQTIKAIGAELPAALPRRWPGCAGCRSRATRRRNG